MQVSLSRRAGSSRHQAQRPCRTRSVVSVSASTVSAGSHLEQLKGAKELVASVIKSKSCNPIIVRLAWHDSGTYNKDVPAWPARGGANASIRFKPEITHGANNGLNAALAILEPVKEQFPAVSYADLFQMASAVAVEVAGGPKIAMRYGRRDVESPEGCAPEGNLPAAGHPFPDGSSGPAQHLRRIFYRMGFDDKEIVALSGGHTLGRARPERSGWGKESTPYTAKGPGAPGGQSWTADWLVFNNSYFTEVKAQRDQELLVLPTDAVIFEDAGFKPHAELYAENEATFFSDYAAAHLKLSELGVEWVEGAPITL